MAQGFALGRLTQDVQAPPYRQVLDLAEVSVDVGEEVRELLGLLLDAEVAVEFRLAQGLPDPDPNRGELRGVQRLYLVVLIEELFELRQIVVGLGAGHRW